MVTGDVDDRDTRLVLTALQVLGNLVPPFFPCPGNPRLEIEAMLEVDVGDVVATDRAVELQSAAQHTSMPFSMGTSPGNGTRYWAMLWKLSSSRVRRCSSWSASDGVMKMRGESQAYAISIIIGSAVPLSPGARLGPYGIVTLLGSGGMGEVYRARDTRLDRTVAIKVLPEALAADPQFRTRFDREARTISQLDHPHICALHDVGEQDGVAYLVMRIYWKAKRWRRGSSEPRPAIRPGVAWHSTAR